MGYDEKLCEIFNNTEFGCVYCPLYPCELCEDEAFGILQLDYEDQTGVYHK